ncbi:MAG: phosphoribosylformylglycinamidine synthase subunit PurS [Halobacteria archaeon]|nr:phosphoribosylformylglycinamidine synthase subunit PurS [Halobacteria archaeon]
MSQYEANVRVSLKQGVLDPEAKTIERSLERLGFELDDLRTADVYAFEIEASDDDEARDTAEEMCEKLLANPVIHDYSVEVEETGGE